MSMRGKICHILIKMFSAWVEDITLIFNYYFFVVDVHGLHSNFQYILHIYIFYVDTNPTVTSHVWFNNPHESPVGHLTMFDLGCVQQSRYDLGSNWVQVAPGGREGSQQHLWWYLGRERWLMYHPTPKPKSYAISILLCERFSNVCADHESTLF